MPLDDLGRTRVTMMRTTGGGPVDKTSRSMGRVGGGASALFLSLLFD